MSRFYTEISSYTFDGRHRISTRIQGDEIGVRVFATEEEPEDAFDIFVSRESSVGDLHIATVRYDKRQRVLRIYPVDVPISQNREETK